MRMFRSLKNIKEFSNVYQNGTSFANKYLVMYICKNEWKENRIGISVSKKVGNSVVRHRLTRLIRESYRLNVSNILCGYDIVIVGRQNAKERSFKEIESAFMHLIRLHHIEVTCKKVEQI